VHLVKQYSLGHAVVVILNVDDVGSFSSYFCIAAVSMSHCLRHSLGCLYLVLLCVPCKLIVV
jgi:hypothetical protein